MGSLHPPLYPNEMLVRTLTSKNFSDLTNHFIELKKKKIGEIGSFAGNNLRFFLDKGFDAYGFEINKEMVEMGLNYLSKLNYKVPKIQIGLNTNIPVRKNFFNCFVSINTLHYNHGKDIHRALKEFKRITNTNGIVIIETIAPEHVIYKNCICKNELEWTWETKGFRKNIKVGLFYSKDHYKYILSKYFKKVEVFERKESMKLNLHYFFAVCLK